ncbi:MAG: hypothetical protein LPH21_16505 [Shewanella sp.]|nr:hypothetical protein [Shewanella sp.]MCF1459077.1 hypothetical protein [Shewanella sp.]
MPNTWILPHVITRLSFSLGQPMSSLTRLKNLRKTEEVIFEDDLIDESWVDRLAAAGYEDNMLVLEVSFGMGLMRSTDTFGFDYNTMKP